MSGGDDEYHDGARYMHGNIDGRIDLIFILDLKLLIYHQVQKVVDRHPDEKNTLEVVFGNRDLLKELADD